MAFWVNFHIHANISLFGSKSKQTQLLNFGSDQAVCENIPKVWLRFTRNLLDYIVLYM